MSERFVDLENSNIYLFDVLFRHQTYLEGIKVGFAMRFKATLTHLYDEFAKFIGQAKYETLDGFTRVELEHFIYRFKQAQTVGFNQYTQQLIALLQQFMDADVEVHKAIFAAATDHPASQHDVVAASFINAKHVDNNLDLDTAQLWATISNQIVPATGQTMWQMLSNFTESATGKVSRQISIGYANASKGRDVLEEIVGSRDSLFRDGAFATFNNQNTALIATMLQHVSSQVQASVVESIYSQDQWVSILDSKTTIICRDRNGNVYPSDQGPYPPAHWFCRSKRVPLTQGDTLHNIPATFYDWLITQPESFLIDALGSSVAAKILSNSVSAKDISVNDVAIPLTVAQFSSKIDLITV